MKTNRFWITPFARIFSLIYLTFPAVFLQTAKAEMSIANEAPPIFNAPPASANAPGSDKKPTNSRPFVRFDSEEQQKSVFPSYAFSKDEAARLVELERARKKNELSLLLQLANDLPGMIAEEQAKGKEAFAKKQREILSEKKASALIPQTNAPSEENTARFESEQIDSGDELQTTLPRRDFRNFRLGVLEKMQESNRKAGEMTVSETIDKAAKDPGFGAAVGIDIVVGGVIRPFFNFAAKVTDEMIRTVQCASLGLGVSTGCSSPTTFQDYWGSLMTGEEKEYAVGDIATDVIGLASGPALVGLSDNVAIPALKHIPNELNKISTAVGEGIERIRLGYPALGFLDDAGNLMVKNASLIRQHFKNESGLASKLIDIYKMPKGMRPSADHYLSHEYIERHLSRFDEGATRFMIKDRYDEFGPAQVDGTMFILPKREADRIFANASASGDIGVLERALGLPPGTYKGQQLIRIDIPNPRACNLRIPSGNEAGVKELWLPGGKLPSGIPEAVIDLIRIPPSQIQVTGINI